MRTLIEFNVDTNITDLKIQATPLMKGTLVSERARVMDRGLPDSLSYADMRWGLACKRGFVDCARLLIRAGAKMNTGDKFLQTALHRGAPSPSRFVLFT